ncbi:putative mitochondrial protein AtMg00860 [Wolffia australiana]
MDPSKVKAIRNWTEPKRVPQLRSFLCLASYYQMFIEGFSRLVDPLMDLLKNDVKWQWTDWCQRAFDKLKGAVSSKPVLRLPKFNKPYEDGHPVAYESCQLNDAERRHSVNEKEMIAVVHCLRAWHNYLLGGKCVVCTDNVATSCFESQKKLTPKQAIW